VLGESRRGQGDLRWAATYLERAHRLATELADVERISSTLVQLGDLHLDRGDIDGAAGRAAEAETCATSNRLVLFHSQAIRLRAAVALRRGDPRAAAQLCERAISQQREARCLIDLERSLSLLADVFAAAGHSGGSRSAHDEAAALRAMFAR
jgi:ATP/maltotriose-dependent transcriptional regulator MalT